MLIILFQEQQIKLWASDLPISSHPHCRGLEIRDKCINALHCLFSFTMTVHSANILSVQSLMPSVQHCFDLPLDLLLIHPPRMWVKSFRVLMREPKYCSFHFLMVMSNDFSIYISSRTDLFVLWLIL